MSVMTTPANEQTLTLYLDRIDTRVGDILLVCHGDAVCALEFAEHEDHMNKLLRARFERFHYTQKIDPLGASSRLQAYLGGELDAMAAVNVTLDGTVFQHKVWSALRAIVFGGVITYRDLATRVHAPNAVRAVAHAVALNPINIAVPCHRVVGACGTLRGYSGGLERKRWLLEHEGVDCRPRALRRRFSVWQSATQ